MNTELCVLCGADFTSSDSIRAHCDGCSHSAMTMKVSPRADNNAVGLTALIDELQRLKNEVEQLKADLERCRDDQ